MSLKNVFNYPASDKHQTRLTRSEYPQILMGGAAGFLSGLVITKIGKNAAIVVGGGIILVEIASLKGLIKIDWFKASEQLTRLGDKIQQFFCKEKGTWSEGSRNFTSANTFFAISFVGGAFLGFGVA